MSCNAGYPATPLDKPGWKLTFYDDFDSPLVNDIYWNTAYRSGQELFYRRQGVPNRGGWTDHNAYYVIENSVLKLRVSETLPPRKHIGSPCVSCFTTSDHRFGATAEEYQILEKFSQKYGWFEMRCKCPRGVGVMSAFWLHQVDPAKQEFTLQGVRKDNGIPLEIDIFEIHGYPVRGEFCTEMNVHFTSDAHYWKHTASDTEDEFHVWAMEWQEGRIDWYVDGELQQSYKGPTPEEKMFILMALFHFKGLRDNVESTLKYPRDFEIDYVKVYSKL